MRSGEHIIGQWIKIYVTVNQQSISQPTHKTFAAQQHQLCADPLIHEKFCIFGSTEQDLTAQLKVFKYLNLSDTCYEKILISLNDKY